MKKTIIMFILLALITGGIILSNLQAETKARSKATITTTLGIIEIELNPEAAPKTVANFIQKVRTKAFTGTTFHRVVPGFVIQGGDPLSKDNDPGNDGNGGGTMGVEGRKLSNVRGSISMASASRAIPINSQSDAQFFINLNDNLGLDQYGFIPFGKVTKGMEVVDQISKQNRDRHDRPTTNITIKAVVIQP